jgi:peroxiredoxin
MKKISIASCLALCVIGIQAASPKTLEIGAVAPDFQLPGVDGKTYSLSDFTAFKYLTVIFTCNHCPTAQSYEERMKALVNDYRSKGIGFVAISPNDPKSVRPDELGYTDLGDTLEDMKIRSEHKLFNFPYLFDGETQTTSKAYGAVATPHVYIFDQDRKLAYTGRIDSTEIKVTAETVHSTRDALDALLSNQSIEVTSTKVFGCSVKWADKRYLNDRFTESWAKREVLVELADSAAIQKLIKNDSEKLRLVNVWATWCGPCVTEFPDLVEMQKWYGNRNFELVTISADKPKLEKKVHRFLVEKQAANPNYLFNSDDAYALIEAVDPKWQGALPYSMLIKPGGEVIYREMGAIDPLDMKRRIVDVIGREKDW